MTLRHSIDHKNWFYTCNGSNACSELTKVFLWQNRLKFNRHFLGCTWGQMGACKEDNAWESASQFW